MTIRFTPGQPEMAREVEDDDSGSEISGPDSKERRNISFSVDSLLSKSKDDKDDKPIDEEDEPTKIAVPKPLFPPGHEGSNYLASLLACQAAAAIVAGQRSRPELIPGINGSSPTNLIPGIGSWPPSPSHHHPGLPSHGVPPFTSHLLGQGE